MLIRMRVLQGPEKGREYECDSEEAVNILVGRKDVRSDAGWLLSEKDHFVSRNHFLIEVRPPNCRLSDPHSKNGTYLLRGGDELKVEEEFLENGERIRIGKTVLEMEIAAEPSVEPSPLPPAASGESPSSDREAKPAAGFNCIRCGNIMEQVLPLYSSNLRDLDFMCTECRQGMEEQQRSRPAGQVRARYLCAGANCGEDLSDMADTDRRAAELADVACYLCPECSRQEEIKARREKDFPQNYIGGYRLIRWLGKGGFGEVFKAWHPETGRLAAIKLMDPFRQSEEALLRRFHREISIMQDLVHPNLVRFYEAGQVGLQPFLVCEYVSGGDSAGLLSDEGRPLYSPHHLVTFIADTLVGLDYFHRREGLPGHKYVHRDIKPENILIWRERDRIIPKLADFGLAKCYEEHGGTITRTRECAGTFMYMAPEQLKNFKYSKPPVDIYAMGVTLYYILSGRYPLDFPPMWQIKKGSPLVFRGRPVNMVLEGKRLPLRRARADLPESLCRVVDKSLLMEPQQRYQTADEFRRALLGAL
jgi:eukaryotic-like serine/threonine-protein kinase